MIYSRVITDVVPEMKEQDTIQMNLVLTEVIGSLLAKHFIGLLIRRDVVDAC